MDVTADHLLNLQRKLARRNLRFRQASRYVAHFNAFSNSRTEAFDERLHRNFEHARDRLAAAQIELREVLASSNTKSLRTPVNDSEATSDLIIHANEGLLKFLSQHPHYLHTLHSRTFEELIARIFIDLGCSVELMRATHDGGKDLIVRTEGPTGPSVAYIQCKRNSPERPVGIEIVRQLYGVQMADHVNQSMIVTTSHFTAEATRFTQDLAFLISLRDYTHIVSWLERYRVAQ